MHPDLLELDPRTMKPTAKIRYTLDDHWLIVKGHSLATPPKYGQFHSLARKLIRQREYMGPAFSWGDNYAAECAKGKATSGNLAKWVKVDTNHHLTFVAHQIASAPVS